MTKTEARDILITRLEFKHEDAVPVSGLYFEAEHPIITVENIKGSQANIQISDDDFSDYLTDLKSDVVYKVLADVFDKDEINDEIFTDYPSILDNLISMQMGIRVINLILSTTRSNRIETLNKASLQKIYFDLKGNKGSEKYPITDGIEDKYHNELVRVKGLLGEQKRFRSITMT